ncbi:mitochondrial group I intron splicing factor CCM1 [Suhomyces tanzawaensis NRRL Y-17324]|uniref:Mitochondrial 15S rRNA processing factor CCM1 n=1 Tax=Suhomyces tanzawaensis NRRL Y-17324 TaxID=984487 RepID=A0A1E4SCX5_9ASCO|nr:mitochondrial group I intron splicing factor CCM1 [Suhomyces tanzawaensis NRRL Y-17324]ODV77343.1 mitochondrial group I intron splicing factor CCM1 [Suhomyces tanzawaensis NRRL Y-17324]
MLQFHIRRSITKLNRHEINLVTRRGIFVANDTKKLRPRKRDDKRKSIDKFLELDGSRKLRQEEAKYTDRLNELKNLTRSVATMIKKREKQEAQQEKIDSIPLPSEINKDQERVFNALGITESGEKVNHLSSALLVESGPSNEDSAAVKISKTSFIVPSVQIPESISEKLGLSLKYLISKTNQNWTMVLEQLRLSGGFKDIPLDDVRSFIKVIPPKQLKENLSIVEHFFEEANIVKTAKLTHLMMNAVNSTALISNNDLQILEDYCTYLKQRSRKGSLSRDTYTIMIQAYGKSNNMAEINRCLEEMKSLKLQVSPEIISNILTTSVYKARDHKQAVEIFDSMKFFSESTKPSTKAYQDILVSYVNNDDIEKALDLYQEMITDRVPLNQNIMVALARGCSSRPELRIKAWDFMFEIYNNGWTPTLQSFEYMLYLASRDGDLALSRALYLKLIKSDSTTAKSFSFLMLAYSKSSIKNDKGYEPPLLNFHEQGRIFRRNILMDSKFESLETGIPFLPIQDLLTKDQILAESSALWAYNLLYHLEYINNESTCTYLNIAAEIGSVDDFIDRFNNSTFFDKTGLPGKRVVQDGEDDTLQSIEIIDPEVPELAQLGIKTDKHKAPILQSMELDNSFKKVKVPRSPLMYVIALKVAGKSKNYDFAQSIWVERGQFRKTSQFRDLESSERDRLDFQFASSMILALTRMNLLQDALSILLSTEYQFKWTWKELTHLHKAAVEIGDDRICKTVRGVAKRAQLNFAGKIRRKDFKRYMMERGF